MAAVKELHAEGFFQQVDLLDDCRGRDVAFFGSLVEAACVGYTEKSFELWIIHPVTPLFVSAFDLEHCGNCPKGKNESAAPKRPIYKRKRIFTAFPDEYIIYEHPEFFKPESSGTQTVLKMSCKSCRILSQYVFP